MSHIFLSLVTYGGKCTRWEINNNKEVIVLQSYNINKCIRLFYCCEILFVVLTEIYK